MLRPIRRVITGHDENGKAVVIQDGPAPNVVVSDHRPGGRTNIWRTTGAPADYGGHADEAAADTQALPDETHGATHVHDTPADDHFTTGVDPAAARARDVRRAATHQYPAAADRRGHRAGRDLNIIISKELLSKRSAKKKI